MLAVAKDYAISNNTVWQVSLSIIKYFSINNKVSPVDLVLIENTSGSI